MKSYRKELWFNVPARRGFINITPEVQEALRESGVQEGLCLVNAMHITASVFINDDESGLHNDYEKWLEGLAPHAPTSQYLHNRTGEDNADAHLKRQVMGREVVAITVGKLDFGPWEQIFTASLTAAAARRAGAGQDYRRVTQISAISASFSLLSCNHRAISWCRVSPRATLMVNSNTWSLFAMSL